MHVLMMGRYSHTGVTAHIFSLASALPLLGVRATVAMKLPSREQQAYHNIYRTPLWPDTRFESICSLAAGKKFDLLHVHSLHLLPVAYRLSQELHIPLGVTVHEGIPSEEASRLIARASFVISPLPGMIDLLRRLSSRVLFIPEGIDVEKYRPAENKPGFTVTFIGEEGLYTRPAYLSLIKALGLTDMSLEVICDEKAPFTGAGYHGWPPCRADILARSQVVAARGRPVLEGMACGNAALILGRVYGGLLQPGGGQEALLYAVYGKGKPPCYKDLFFDLSKLWKDRQHLLRLQQRGRQWVLENFDLRLAAERTVRVYELCL